MLTTQPLIDRHDPSLWRELGPAAARRRRPRVRRRRLRASDFVDVGRRPDGRAARPPPALRLRPAPASGQRPPDLLQGARLAAAVRAVQGGRRDHRRGAADLPPARQPARRPPDAARCRGSTSATGSLGQGLPVGVGMALAGKRLDRLPYRVWVLCGDSELAEGSMWEALEHAAHDRPRQPHRDRRRQPARPARPDPARLGPRRLRPPLPRPSAGTPIEIDGHDVDADRPRLRPRRVATRRPARPRSSPAPSRARASPPSRTARACTASRCRTPTQAIAELGGVRDLRVAVPSRPPARDAARRARPAASTCRAVHASATRSPPATRTARRSPRSAPPRGDVVALDGEVGDSTHAEFFAKAHPDRFFECYIAEQQLVAAAVGLQARGWIAVRLHLRRVPDPRPRLHPDGRHQRRRHQPRRLARRRRDRRRTGPPRWAWRTWRCCAPCTADRALPVRRQPDRRSSSPRWPTTPGIRYLRTTRGATAGHLRARRGVPGRRQSRCCAPPATRPGHARRRRRHRARGARAADALAADGHPRPGHRPVLRQAGRRRHAARRPPRDDRPHRRRRGPPPRAASATRSSSRWPTPTRAPSRGSPSTRCRPPDAPRNCCGAAASTGLDRDRRPRPARADPGAHRSPSRPRTRLAAGSMMPAPSRARRRAARRTCEVARLTVTTRRARSRRAGGH